MQVALEQAKEEAREAGKRVDEAGTSFIEVDQKRIDAEGRAIVTKRKVLTAVEDFKNSADRTGWCQKLSTDSVMDALDEIFAFVQNKAPGLDLTGCPYYVEPEIEDNIDSGDEDDIHDDPVNDGLTATNIVSTEILSALQPMETDSAELILPPPSKGFIRKDAVEVPSDELTPNG